MKALVIGSTGLTGRILIRKLLEGGHEVTAFARNPADVAERSARLRVMRGEARDAASIAAAVQGQDAVISAFGPRSLKADDLAESLMRNLVAAMETQGVKRLVNLSAAGVGDSLKEMPFLLAKIVIPLFLARAYADKERGEAILFASALEFVNVRPGRLTNKPARGGVKASLRAKGLKLEMSREDLAAFMIGQLGDRQWLRRSPIIGY